MLTLVCLSHPYPEVTVVSWIRAVSRLDGRPATRYNLNAALNVSRDHVNYNPL